MNQAIYQKLVAKAIHYFWGSRQRALEAKLEKGSVDQGNRGGATAGKNLDGFAAMIAGEVKKVGPKDLEIHMLKQLVVLPGYFRPAKQWDVVVVYKAKLLAAIELKSLGGPSYGNNANNRCEEALGSGVDFRTAQREGAFGAGAAPFLGFMILVQDDLKSSSPPAKERVSPHFSIYPEFQTASYQSRMAILCEKMVQEGIYDCAAAISSPLPLKAKDSGQFKDLSANNTLRHLLIKLCAHVAAEIALARD
ncbi:MAG: PaeR7I family type II restriction endonuclease [Luteolibacter sp.]